MRVISFSRGVLIFSLMILWSLISVIVYTFPSSLVPDNQTSITEEEEMVSHSILEQVQILSAHLEKVKEQNAYLEQVIYEEKMMAATAAGGGTSQNLSFGGKKQAKLLANSLIHSSDRDPSFEMVGNKNYDKYKKFLDQDVKELGYLLRLHAKNMGTDDADQITDLYRQIQSDLDHVQNYDGRAAFRERELRVLGAIVQNRIGSLQNPSNCSTTETMLCKIGSECGFGCQIHHIGRCLLMAHGRNKTLILESRGWHYEPKGWDQIFMPLSGATCQNHRIENVTPLYPSFGSEPIDFFNSIPRDIRIRLERVHLEPHIWWVGQFMKYVLRLRPQTEAAIMKMNGGITRSDLSSSPIVGVHVRRTDKLGTEASFHSLQQYMDHVTEFFEIFEKMNKNSSSPDDPRQIFIASDDPTVLPEARQSYPMPKWNILGHEGVAQSASTERRYSPQGLYGVIEDLLTLSSCDFLVCTFSSRICRMAYELMQTRDGGDHSQKIFSLDDLYYFTGGNLGTAQTYVAHAKHNPKKVDEIGLEVGDTIELMGNHWDGQSKGRNEKSGQVGLFPSYKIRRFLRKTDDRADGHEFDVGS